MRLRLHGQLLYTGHVHGNMPTGEAAVACNALRFAYPGKSDAIKDVTFGVRAGEQVVVLGPNGAGKSTLLKLIAGLLKCTQPDALKVFGSPVDACHPHTGYLAQRNEVNWRVPLTVRDVAMQGRYPHMGWLARPDQTDQSAVDSALDAVGLHDMGNASISELSGGQQQRAFIARALAQNAHLLLLDEPFTGLDAEAQRILLALLQRFRAEGRTVLISTHDLGPVIAGGVAERAILVNKVLLADGPVADVLRADVLARAYA